MDSQARPDLTAKIAVDELTVGKLLSFLAWVTQNGADEGAGVWLTDGGELVGSTHQLEIDCAESEQKVSGNGGS